jgi:pSer/pThr/pTyr-binding forkhead associated (FHA) protein
MTEKRAIIGHSRHGRQGPHRPLPTGFAPLRLYVEAHSLQIEVVVPVVRVGRHSNSDLRLGDADISRQHCQFVFESGQWRVYDLHSLNGVFVNNAAAADATLFAGDRVRVGSVTFLVLSATPVYEERDHEKLRQIVDVLPN